MENLGKTIAAIHDASPSTEITIVGVVPQWRPTLPAAMSRQKIAISPELYLRSADFAELSGSDQQLQLVAAKNNAHFFSALKALCERDKCRATTMLNGATVLTAYDFGHLTAGGSVLLARKLLEP